MPHVHLPLVKNTDTRSLSDLTLVDLRDRIMLETDGRKLANVLAEVASRLDMNVCLEDFHVAQQLFHVAGLNTRLQTTEKWTSQDAERFYWQKRRLFRAFRRIRPNWRALHRCDEFCVDDCYFVCAVNDKVCYKCVIQYPIYIAKYPPRSYFSNVMNIIKTLFTGKTGNKSD